MLTVSYVALSSSANVNAYTQGSLLSVFVYCHEDWMIAVVIFSITF